MNTKIIPDYSKVDLEDAREAELLLSKLFTFMIDKASMSSLIEKRTVISDEVSRRQMEYLARTFQKEKQDIEPAEANALKVEALIEVLMAIRRGFSHRAVTGASSLPDSVPSQDFKLMGIGSFIAENAGPKSMAFEVWEKFLRVVDDCRCKALMR